MKPDKSCKINIIFDSMMSEIPKGIGKLDAKSKDRELLRVGLIAELDAINLYEQLAAEATDERIKKLFLEIAREEKTHVGEFLAVLLEKDEEQVKELDEGKKEVEEI